MNRNLSSLCPRSASIVAWLLGIVAICLASSFAEAGIVSSSGVTVLAAPPPGNVLPGTNTTNPNPIIFPEVIGGVVPAGGIAVDHDGSVVTAGPLESGNLVNANLVPAVIATGTRVDSYFLHFDPTDPPPNAHFYDSSILFSGKILGVEVFTSAFASLQKPAATPYVGTLEAGDAAVIAMGGPGAAYYPVGLNYRGMEEDGFQITNGGFSIEFGGEVDGLEIDQARIFVASAVPEPNSIFLAFMGLLGLAFLHITRVGVVRPS